MHQSKKHSIIRRLVDDSTSWTKLSKIKRTGMSFIKHNKKRYNMTIKIITTFLLGILLSVFSSCIGDDLVFDELDPMVFFTSTIETLALGASFQLEAKFLNNVGVEQVLPKEWISSAPDIISVDQQGVITGVATGIATITAELSIDDAIYQDDITIEVGEETVEISGLRSGEILTTSSYKLSGNFTLEEINEELVLSIDESYETTSALPGLYIYLTNNPASNAGAFEIGEVTVFSGAHTYTISGDVGINDYQYLLYYCKPFSVKVGEGKFDN